MQGTTTHSCSEKIQPKLLNSSHFSLSLKLYYIAIRQRAASLQTAALSHPEKAEVRPHLDRSCCVFILSVCLHLLFRSNSRAAVSSLP